MWVVLAVAGTAIVVSVVDAIIKLIEKNPEATAISIVTLLGLFLILRKGDK